MGCSEESGFRGPPAPRRDQPLQTRRAEPAGPDQAPPRRLRNASTPPQIRSSRGSRQTASGVSSGSRQASLPSWEFRCDGTGALCFPLRAVATKDLRQTICDKGIATKKLPQILRRRYRVSNRALVTGLSRHEVKFMLDCWYFEISA